MHGELCMSSGELLSGYDTLGSYKLPDPRKPWLEAAHGYSLLTVWQEMQSPGPKRLGLLPLVVNIDSLPPGRAIMEASLLSFSKY